MLEGLTERFKALVFDDFHFVPSVFRFFVEHLSEKKNLAATCIQSTWRLHHFVMENADTLILDDWFKSQKLRLLQHKMSENIRRWRVVRKSWSRGK